MAKQDKPTGQQQQHRKRTLWRVLLPGALLVALVLVLALGLFGTPPAAPLPLRVQASPSRVVALAHLEQLSDLSLPGGTSRFDYQSVDPRTRLLLISHLGASSVTVFDLASGRIRANIASISQVHGVLAIPDLGRVYASATGEDQVVAIDEHSLRVMATIPAGVYPDGRYTQNIMTNEKGSER
jgi:YVTN family beta-propeller protein